MFIFIRHEGSTKQTVEQKNHITDTTVILKKEKKTKDKNTKTLIIKVKQFTETDLH